MVCVQKSIRGPKVLREQTNFSSTRLIIRLHKNRLKSISAQILRKHSKHVIKYQFVTYGTPFSSKMMILVVMEGVLNAPNA